MQKLLAKKIDGDTRGVKLLNCSFASKRGNSEVLRTPLRSTGHVAMMTKGEARDLFFQSLFTIWTEK